MFPPLKIELFDLDPTTYYVLLMDMAPVDKYRYKYQNSSWVKCFEEECSPTRLYIHPDSPALGSHWMNTIINFYKLKLTNNQLDKQGHVSRTNQYSIVRHNRLSLLCHSRGVMQSRDKHNSHGYFLSPVYTIILQYTSLYYIQLTDP